jgi:hypothetical protein
MPAPTPGDGFEDLLDWPDPANVECFDERDPEIQALRDVIELLLVGQANCLDDGVREPHALEVTLDGDGWFEPLSEHHVCACGEWSREWVQTDPASSTRISSADVALDWRDHINACLSEEPADVITCKQADS